jgi:AcrR family transcriptional regulator
MMAETIHPVYEGIPMQKTLSKKNRKRRNTLVRQRQIIEAARGLIIKYGSEHVTVRKIAEEIGISEGALYRHFKSKREILLFLIQHIKEYLLNDFPKKTSSKYILCTLENTLKNHLSSMEQRKGISFLVIAEILSMGDRGLNRRALEVLKKYIDDIKKLLLEGIKTGEIRQNIDPEMTAYVFLGAIQGLITIWALSDYNFILEKKFKPLWKVLCQAIKRD